MSEEDNRPLPQARMYLKTARWGFDELMQRELSGYGYRFHMVGILSALRAVQHALYNHDRKLSERHAAVVGTWWAKSTSAPELAFIKFARDQILKGGSFESYALSSHAGTGEGENYEVLRGKYELAYYDANGRRRNLARQIRRALDWCEREVSQLEAELLGHDKSDGPA